MQSEETTRRELTPADYLAMLRRHWVLILVLTVVGPPIGYGVSRVVPPRYVSQSNVLVQQPTVPSSIVPSMDTTSMNQKLATLKQQIESRTSLEPLIHQYNLYGADINKKSMDELVGRLQSAIDVTPVAPMTDAASSNKDLSGFSVSVTLEDPHKAQDVCTQITSMFIIANNGNTEQRSDQVTHFVTEQLATAKTALDTQESKLAAFEAQHVGTLPDDEQSNLNILAGLNSQFDAASQAIENAQRDKSYAETLLEHQLAAGNAISPSGQSPSTLEQQLTTLKTQLANLQSAYKDTYPDVVKAKADIAQVEKEIAASSNASASTDEAGGHPIESAEVTQLRAQINGYNISIGSKTKEQEQLTAEIKTYRDRVQQSPLIKAQYTELTRGHDTAQTTYNELLKEQHDAEMAGDLNRQQQGQYFNVLDPANFPGKPTFPNRMMFTGGGLAGGLGLALGIVLFIELKDTSLKSERDVESTLRLPVLAMIPAVEPVISKKSDVIPTLQRPHSDASLSVRA